MSLRALGTAALSALKEAAPRAARGAPTPPAPHQGHTRPARKAAEAYLRDHVFIVYSAGATRQQRAHSVGRTAWLRLRCATSAPLPAHQPGCRLGCCCLLSRC
jgi:hypothetical protein